MKTTIRFVATFICVAVIMFISGLIEIGAQSTNLPGVRPISGASSNTNSPGVGSGSIPSLSLSQVLVDAYGRLRSPTNVIIGFVTNIVSTVLTENTNELYVTGAGTNAANGKYKFKQNAFTAGWVFTNTTAAGFICKNLAGFSVPQDGEQENHPFYMGPTTNDNMTCWYFSRVDVRAGWDNFDGNLGNDTSQGPQPFPTVRYGTNTTLVTNTVLAVPQTILALAGGKQLLVDQVYGNDTGAALGLCAFKTCAAAKSAAQSGYTIVVNPGTYYETNLLKNGVNWKFQPGTTVGYESQPWQGVAPVFTDVGVGAVTSNIEGDIFHYRSESSFGSHAMLFTNPASRVTIKFNESDCVYFSPYANTTVNRYSSICLVSNCSYLQINIKSIGNRLSGTTSSGIDYRDDSNTYGQLVNRPASEMGFIWHAGEEHIEFDRMYALAGERFQAAFWSHGASVTDSTDLYIRGNLLQGLIYTDGASTNSRIWIDIAEHTTAAGGISCYFPYGFEKIYIDSQKIDSGVNTCFNFAGGGAHKLWLRAEKVSAAGGSWLTIAAGGHTIFADVQQFEDTAGSSGSVGINSTATGVALSVKGHVAKNRGTILNWASPSSTAVFEGIKLDTSSGTNAAISVGQAGLTLINSRLVSGSTNAIYAGSAQTVSSIWTVANKTNHLNITLSPNIGPFTNSALIQ